MYKSVSRRQTDYSANSFWDIHGNANCQTVIFGNDTGDVFSKVIVTGDTTIHLRIVDSAAFWSGDSDLDAVADGCDNCPDNFNPNQANSDSDDFPDSCDNCPYAYNPDQIDTDANQIGDACDIGCCTLRGDVANPIDGSVLINDLTFLVDYLFKGGAQPGCIENGDCAVPLDGSILVNDLVFLVDYLFKGGAIPPSC